MNPIGMILANFYPFLFLQLENTTYKKQKIEVFNYLTSYMLVSCLWFILAISSFYQRDQRFDDDSLDEEKMKIIQEEKEVEKFTKIDFRTQIKVLTRDRSYVGMFLAAGVAYGCFSGVQFSVNFIVSVWGYEEVRLNLIILLRFLEVIVYYLEQSLELLHLFFTLFYSFLKEDS